MEATSIRANDLSQALEPEQTTPFRHFVNITRALAVTEFKLRYFDSVLGYLWTVLRPLMLFGVLYLVFTEIVPVGDQVPHYAVILLAALVMFYFFGEATNNGLTSLVARESLIRKVAFPRMAIPVAVAMTSAANLVFGVAIVFLFAIIDGITPSLTWILFLCSVSVVVVMATAMTTLLSALYVRFRDIQPIWEVFLQFLFWGSAIFYTINDVPKDVQPYFLCNPMAAVIQQGRHWLSPTSTVSLPDAMGSPELVLVPISLIVMMVVVGLLVFRRAEPTLAEDM